MCFQLRTFGDTAYWLRWQKDGLLYIRYDYIFYLEGSQNYLV